MRVDRVLVSFDWSDGSKKGWSREIAIYPTTKTADIDGILGEIKFHMETVMRQIERDLKHDNP